MVEIIPAIIAKTYEEFQAAVSKMESFVKRVSFDVMDGVFVPNKTVGFETLNKIGTPLAFDVHLMINRPENSIDDWLSTKADRLFVHVESTSDVSLHSVIGKIAAAGREVGLVLNPETSIEKITEYVGDIQYVQFMTVHPGFYGGTFIEQVVPKIREFHGQYPKMPIIVDGGIVPETAKTVADAGATILISGSYVMTSDDPAKAIAVLRQVTSS